MRATTLAPLALALLISAWNASASPIHVGVRGTLDDRYLDTGFDLPDGFSGGTLALGEFHVTRPAPADPRTGTRTPFERVVDSPFTLQLTFTDPSRSVGDTDFVALGGDLRGKFHGGSLTSNIAGGFEGLPRDVDVRAYGAGSGLSSGLLEALGFSRVVGTMTGGIRNILALSLVVPRVDAVPTPGGSPEVPEPAAIALWGGGFLAVASRRRGLFRFG